MVRGQTHDRANRLLARRLRAGGSGEKEKLEKRRGRQYPRGIRRATERKARGKAR